MKILNLQFFAVDKSILKKYYEEKGKTGAGSSTSTGNASSSGKSPATSSGIGNSKTGAMQNTQYDDVVAPKVDKSKVVVTPTTPTNKGVGNSKTVASEFLQYEEPTVAKVVTPKAPVTTVPKKGDADVVLPVVPETPVVTMAETKKKTKKEDKTEDGSWGAVVERPGPDIETKLGITTVPKEWPKTGDTSSGGDDTYDSNPVPIPAGVDKDSVIYITTPIQESAESLAAKQYTAELLAKLRGGKTSYSDQLNDLINQYLSRGKFSYDPNTDTMFQSQLASAMQSGQMAMQDTMGQAAALTGGYGSSYATSAANQAYNSYVQGAYDNITDYYQMALGQYQMEGQDMLAGISLVADQDAQEWGRLIDEYGANSGWYGALSDNDYRNRSLLQDAYTSLIKMQNSDYWNGAEMAQNQSQFDAEMGYKYDALGQEMGYKYDALGQSQSQFDAEMGYKYDALGEDKREADLKDAQFYASLANSSEAPASDVGGIDLTGGAARAYQNGGPQGVFDYLERQRNSDPATYSYDVVSKVFKSITGEDYSGYASKGTKTSDEISTGMFNGLVDAFVKYYADGGTSEADARYAISDYMEANAKYFDQFSESALSEIIDMAIEAGNKNRHITGRY